MTRAEIREKLEWVIHNIPIPEVNDAYEYILAVKEANKALELIGYLKDRPCEACVFHSEDGCCKWNCVFNELIYGNK